MEQRRKDKREAEARKNQLKSEAAEKRDNLIAQENLAKLDVCLEKGAKRVVPNPRAKIYVGVFYHTATEHITSSVCTVTMRRSE